ncbi:MAG TPA: hypothetical protein PLZ51_20820, partial [Aggregatilineales bacterium]|nr:hypothetical protein [Aggregatilineales bacterium]
ALRESVGLSLSASNSYPAVAVQKVSTGSSPNVKSVLAEKPRSNNTLLLLGGILSGMFIIAVVLFALMSNSQNTTNQEATGVAKVANETQIAEQAFIASQTQQAQETQQAIQTQQAQLVVDATQTMQAIRNLTANVLIGEAG